MTKDMFVWRKSVYENHFKCNECGAKLFNEKTKTPTDYLVIDDSDKNADGKSQIVCYCGKCQNAVATWQTVEGEQIGNDDILQGSYAEWLEKKAQDLNAEMRKRTAEHYEKKYEQRIKALEDKIASKDSTIAKMKVSQEAHVRVLEAKIQELSKEIRHLEGQIDKYKQSIEDYLDKDLKRCKKDV